jgi:repressor LexA
MKENLTFKQQQFLDYLTREIAGNGRAPSLRKAAADMKVSHSAISQMVKTLEAKGMIRRDGYYSRTIHLLNRAGDVDGSMRFIEIPIIGSIAAGLPLYAQQEWDGSVVLDAEIYNGANLFALRVKGDSMTGIGVLDGDLAICEPSQFAKNGEIVVALIHHEEATVKRFFIRENHIELRPENSAYEPVCYAFNEVLVQGRVVGVHRGPDVMDKL